MREAKALIGRAWDNFIRRPGVTALRRHYASQIAFVEARLSPEGYLGLRLTVGAAVLIAAAWLFGAIAEDVVTNDPLTVIDVRVAGSRVNGPHVATWGHERRGVVRRLRPDCP